MIKSNLSPTLQSGFKQQTIYRMPKSQGSTIECNTLNFGNLGADYFVGDPLLYACMHVATPAKLQVETLEFGICIYAPYQSINIANIYRDINLKLFDIVSGKKRLLLRKPIEVTPDFRDGIWTMENKDLDIIAMSTDYKECLRDFYDEVFFVYEEYGQEDDDKLTNGAKELKTKILQYVYPRVGASSTV